MDYRKLNAWPEKDHFLMPSWIRYWIDLLEKGGTIFSMDIRGIIKLLLHQKIKRKPLLLFHMGPQRTRHISEMYDVDILRHGRKFLWMIFLWLVIHSSSV